MEWNKKLFRMVEDIYSMLEVKNGETVVDVGCGAAYFGRFLPPHLSKLQLYGVDIDDAAKLGLKYNYKKIYIKDLEKDYQLRYFKDNSIDYIIAKDILEHLQRPWHLVKEMYRILKPGGKVYAHVPNYTSSMAWIDYTHVRPYSKRSLRLMFEDYGFKTLVLNHNMFWAFSHKFFTKTLVNLPFFWRFAGGVEIVAQKPK